MRGPILYGEFDLTVDDKNRLLVPAEVRRAINPDLHGDAFFLVIGSNRKLWFYPEHYYEELVATSPNDLVPGEDQLAYDQLKFAMVSRVERDAQGRMVLPERALRRTCAGREVTLIGARDHLELWNRSEWNRQFEDLFQRSTEIEQRVRASKANGQSGSGQSGSSKADNSISSR